MKIDSIRREYILSELSENSIDKNPFRQFQKWMEEAIKSEVAYPTAMVLSTFETDSFPQSRIVLLKDFSEDGYVFFTNYNSEKGKAIENNQKVGILFFWPELERQVRISGYAEKTSEKTSNNYFYSRPEPSQIGAVISPQSSEIPDRNYLVEKFTQYQKDNKNIVRPEYWGGYLVRPVKTEFWQGRESRLHDRLLYEKINNNWTLKRLAP